MAGNAENRIDRLPPSPAMNALAVLGSFLAPILLIKLMDIPDGLFLAYLSINGCIYFFSMYYAGKKRVSFRLSGRQALFHRQLLQALGILSGLAVFYLGIQLLTPAFNSKLTATYYESLITPVVYWLSALTALLPSSCFLAIPKALQDAVMSGRITTRYAQNVLGFGAYWLVVLSVMPVIGAWLPKDFIFFDNHYHVLSALFLLASASVAGYFIPYWLVMRFSAGRDSKLAAADKLIPQSNSVWLVYPASGISKNNLKAIDQISMQSKYIPFTLAMPAGSNVFGMHSFWAYSANRLKALYPTRKIELQDWRRSLPATATNAGFNRREIYPSQELLPEAVSTLRSGNDSALLFCEPGADLEPWRGLLPGVKTRVILLEGDPKQPFAQDIAGYRTAHIDDISSVFDSLFLNLEEIEKSKKPRLFISYVSEYSHYAQLLSEALSPHCLILNNFPDDSSENRNALLGKADAVAVLAGSGKVNSFYQSLTLEHARSKGKPIFPIFVNQPKYPAIFHEYQAANVDSHGQIQYLDNLTGERLASIINSAANNILQALVKSSPIPQAEGTEKPLRWVLWLFWQLFWQGVKNYRLKSRMRRLIAVLIVLFVLAAGWYLITIRNCNSDDPPIECKFNQGE